jgi:hypothetical protein
MQIISKWLERFKPPKRIPLDNAAQFFPGTSSCNDTWVFRLTCELTEAVDPWTLQYAAEDALKQYPLYRRVLHKGLFWYSLEESKRQPIVRKERTSPCRTLYERNYQCLQFSVTYFSERINLEVYHALSDAMGALSFFKLLISSYLMRKHPECGLDSATLKDELSSECANEDGFKTYYSGTSIREAFKDQNTAQRGRSWKKRGYQLCGARERGCKIKLIAGVADADEVVAKAHEYGVTATVLLTTVLMLAIQRTRPMSKNPKPIVVSIPVNLRKYFPSKSARNFFRVINVGHYFNRGTDSLLEVVQHVGEQLARELTPEGLITRMNALCSLEHSPLLRLIPRQGKDVALRMAGILESINTTSVSNLGQISIPPELKFYVSLFDFTTSTRRLQLNVCSYENQMVMDIASRLKSTKIQEEFFSILSEIGITMGVPKGQGINDYLSEVVV